jgi:prevent-host-death family protein
MKYSTQIKPITYLKANAAEVLEQLSDKREPLVITQNGEAKAVIQDIVSFEQTQETLALLKILALGSKELEEGKTVVAGDAFRRVRAKRGDNDVER